MHDHFRPYCGRIDKVAHAFCNAHILRELEGLIEFDSEPWAELMRDLLLEANAAVREAREAGATALAPERIRGLCRPILGGGPARPRVSSRIAQARDGQAGKAPEAAPRPQSAHPAEEVQNRNATVSHRFRRPLHQQSGRTGPEDDEGQDENLRLVPNPRRRPDLRPPAIGRLHRAKAGMQYSPNPRSSAKQHHARPDRVANGLGVTMFHIWPSNPLIFLHRVWRFVTT